MKPAFRFAPHPRNEAADTADRGKAGPAGADRIIGSVAAAGTSPGARIPVYFPKRVTSKTGVNIVDRCCFIDLAFVAAVSGCRTSFAEDHRRQRLWPVVG